MEAEALHTKALFADLDKATGELLKLITGCGEEAINIAPFKDSWTVAQLADHVTKSNRSIVQSLNVAGQVTDKNPAERVEEIKDMFLDFSIKMKSPDFIVPSKNIYNKEAVVEALHNSVNQLTQLAKSVDLSQTLTHPAFGEITKYEILYFVVFHTQRHIHQLHNILNAINTSTSNKKKTNIMTTINAYVGFNGQCREAMNFYKDCLGGELILQTVEGSPIEAQCPAAMKGMILHASLTNNSLVLMGSDMVSPAGYTKGNNIALSINCSSEEELNSFFAKLSEGGTVIDPVKKQFWGAIFGVCSDKYGITWMFNYQVDAPSK